MYRGRFNWSNILKDSTALSGFEYTNRSRMQGIQAARAAYAQRAAHRGTNFLDNSGDMAKVFGMQPYPPDAKSERKVNEVNGGNAGPATAPMGVDKMKVRRAVQAIEEERQIPTAETVAVADMGPALLPGRSPEWSVRRQRPTEREGGGPARAG